MKTPLIYLSIITYMSILFFNKLNAQYLNARDLIITKEGDSIRAKVTKRDEDLLYFTFIYNDEVRNIQLPVSIIKSYKKEFYIDNEVLIPKESLPGYKDYKSFRVSFNTGFSYMIAKVEGPNAEALKKIKSGYHFGLDLTSFQSESFGVGVKYVLFRSSLKVPSFSHHFIGPSFSIRFFDSNQKNSFIISLALGHMGYKAEGLRSITITNNFTSSFNSYPYNYSFYNSSSRSLTTTASTLGAVIDIGYNLELAKNISLGFQFSTILGSSSKYKEDGDKVELDDGEREGMNRLDFSIGLRYNN